MFEIDWVFVLDTFRPRYYFVDFGSKRRVGVDWLSSIWGSRARNNGLSSSVIFFFTVFANLWFFRWFIFVQTVIWISIFIFCVKLILLLNSWKWDWRRMFLKLIFVRIVVCYFQSSKYSCKMDKNLKNNFFSRI